MPDNSVSLRVYEAHFNGKPRIRELVSVRKATRMVKAGDATVSTELDGETVCLVLIGPEVGAPLRPLGMRVVNPKDMDLERSSTAFTLPEVNALAGTNFRHGRSLTARMTEEQRQARKDKRGNQLPSEDLIERATNKKIAWGRLGPALQELVRLVPSLEAVRA